MSTPQTSSVEPNSLSETLLEIAAKHGNDASVDIVASYAAALSDSGRNALMQAIAECYPSNRAAFGVWQPIETAPRDGTWILLYDPMTSALIYSGCYDARFDSKWDPEKDEMEYVGQWTNYHVESFGYEEHQILAPTHWMPLPPPPQD